MSHQEQIPLRLKLQAGRQHESATFLASPGLCGLLLGSTRTSRHRTWLSGSVRCRCRWVAGGDGRGMRGPWRQVVRPKVPCTCRKLKGRRNTSTITLTRPHNNRQPQAALGACRALTWSDARCPQVFRRAQPQLRGLSLRLLQPHHRHVTEHRIHLWGGCGCGHGWLEIARSGGGGIEGARRAPGDAAAPVSGVAVLACTMFGWLCGCGRWRWRRRRRRREEDGDEGDAEQGGAGEDGAGECVEAQKGEGRAEGLVSGNYMPMSQS